MECREVRRAISDFLSGDYPLAYQEELLWHIKNCPDCKEELSLSLELQDALNALDENVDFDYIDSEARLKEVLDKANLRIINYNRILKVKSSIKTVAGWAVIFTVLIQILYWMQL